MLVQLSPWETAGTSIESSWKGKRRKRSSDDSLPIVSSFVTVLPSRTESKKQRLLLFDEDLTPVITVCSPHRMTVVGRSNGDRTLQESTLLQYTTRPGSSSSFWEDTKSASQNGGKRQQVPKLAPLLCGFRVFAFQNGNTRLSCWHAKKANGPEDRMAIQVILTSPAVTMSTLLVHNRIVIYGTCQDGRLYFAKFHRDKKGTETLSVDYIDHQNDDALHHIGTFARMNTTTTVQLGKKRKASDFTDVVTAYQIYCEDAGTILVARYEMQLENNPGDSTFDFPSNTPVTTARIRLVSEEAKEGMRGVPVLRSDSISTVALVYSVGRPGLQARVRKCCAIIDLERGDLSLAPFDIPSTVEQTGFATPALLTVASPTHLHLYDTTRGVCVSSEPISNIVGKETAWALNTNPKRGTIGLVFTAKKHLSVALTSVHHTDEQSVDLSLAQSIASAAHSHVGHLGCLEKERVPTLKPPGILGEASGAGRQPVADAVKRALKQLEAFRIMILDEKADNSKNSSLLQVYDAAVKTVLDALTAPEKSVASRGDAKEAKSMNGLDCSSQPQGFSPDRLPQSFIDGAADFIVSLLRIGKSNSGGDVGKRVMHARLNARLILQKLLETGKLSARRHFQSRAEEQDEECHFLGILRSLKLTNKRNRRVFSPVDFMLEMLHFCPDVTERQRVTMLHYMFCRALPDDVAFAILESRQLHYQHPHKLLCRKFLSLRDNKVSTEEERDSLAKQVLNAGSFYLLERVVGYSRCNASLLRTALLEELPVEHESQLLARKLADYLALSVRKGMDRCESQRVSVQLTQWISALCDTFRDQLTDPHPSGGESGISYIQKTVSSLLNESEHIEYLQEPLKRAIDRVRAGISASKEQAGTDLHELLDGVVLDCYALERLSF